MLSGWITRAGALDSDGDTPLYYLLVKVRTTQLPAFADYAMVSWLMVVYFQLPVAVSCVVCSLISNSFIIISP